MIESVDYGLQFLVLAFCGAAAGTHAARTRARGWLILAFLYACYAMGDLYWLLCLFFRELRPAAPAPAGLAWLVPVFTAASCLFFFRWGDYAGNVISAVLMGRAGWMICQGLAGTRGQVRLRRIYLLCAVFFLTE